MGQWPRVDEQLHDPWSDRPQAGRCHGVGLGGGVARSGGGRGRVGGVMVRVWPTCHWTLGVTRAWNWPWPASRPARRRSSSCRAATCLPSGPGQRGIRDEARAGGRVRRSGRRRDHRPAGTAQRQPTCATPRDWPFATACPRDGRCSSPPTSHRAPTPAGKSSPTAASASWATSRTCSASGSRASTSSSRRRCSRCTPTRATRWIRSGSSPSRVTRSPTLVMADTRM